MCSTRMTASVDRDSEPLCASFKTAPDYRFNITPVQLKPAAPAFCRVAGFSYFYAADESLPIGRRNALLTHFSLNTFLSRKSFSLD